MFKILILIDILWGIYLGLWCNGVGKLIIRFLTDYDRYDVPVFSAIKNYNNTVFKAKRVALFVIFCALMLIDFTANRIFPLSSSEKEILLLIRVICVCCISVPKFLLIKKINIHEWNDVHHFISEKYCSIKAKGNNCLAKRYYFTDKYLSEYYAVCHTNNKKDTIHDKGTTRNFCMSRKEIPVLYFDFGHKRYPYGPLGFQKCADDIYDNTYYCITEVYNPYDSFWKSADSMLITSLLSYVYMHEPEEIDLYNGVKALNYMTRTLLPHDLSYCDFSNMSFKTPTEQQIHDAYIDHRPIVNLDVQDPNIQKSFEKLDLIMDSVRSTNIMDFTPYFYKLFRNLDDPIRTVVLKDVTVRINEFLQHESEIESTCSRPN